MVVPEIQPESTLRRRFSLFLLCVTAPLFFISMFLWLARVDNEYYPYGSSCNNNLKQLCLIFHMYADEHGDVFPELSPMAGVLAVREDEDYPGVYPEYLTDLSVLTCSSTGARRPRDRWFWEDPPPPPRNLGTASNDECYLYLGYVIPDQAALERFAEAYRARTAAGQPFDEDLNTTGDDGASLPISRLRADVPGITDSDNSRAATPVLIERHPAGHIPEGGNVVYLDGHVDFIKWGTKWPMTPEAMEVLLALDGLVKQ